MKKKRDLKKKAERKGSRGGRRPPRLGQHFLTAPSIVRLMADTGGVGAGEHILEIGPGKGVLTRELLARGAVVHAVEKDKTLFTALTETFAKEIRGKKLVLEQADIRNFEPSNLPSYKLVANIPYYLSGYILEKFLSATHQPISITLMIQKEVAERVVAKNQPESLLSIAVKAYGTPQFVRKIAPGSFSPPPSIESAILHIANISKNNFISLDETVFFKLLKAGFSHRRKVLIRNLEVVIFAKKLAPIFQDMGLASTARAETLNLQQWLELAASIKDNQRIPSC